MVTALTGACKPINMVGNWCQYKPHSNLWLQSSNHTGSCHHPAHPQVRSWNRYVAAATTSKSTGKVVHSWVNVSQRRRSHSAARSIDMSKNLLDRESLQGASEEDAKRRRRGQKSKETWKHGSSAVAGAQERLRRVILLPLRSSSRTARRMSSTPWFQSDEGQRPT